MMVRTSLADATNAQERTASSRRISWRKGCSILVLSLTIFMSVFAVTAAANTGKVWLDWVYMNAAGKKRASARWSLKAEAQPLYHSWACANMYYNETETTVFSYWYCGAPKTDGTTPELSQGTWSQPAAWNDSSYGQEVWAWIYEE
jgi:hypothetical protein